MKRMPEQGNRPDLTIPGVIVAGIVGFILFTQQGMKDFLGAVGNDILHGDPMNKVLAGAAVLIIGGSIYSSSRRKR